MNPIHSERLTLVPLNEDNLRMALWSWQALEEALNLVPTDTSLRDTVQNAIAAKIHKMADEQANLPWITYWLIVEKAEQQASGLVGFKGVPDEAGRVEIGYGTFEHAQGRGIMTEAVKRLVEWAFKQKPELTITAETYRDNISSQRVLEKAGFDQVHETEGSLWWQTTR